MPASPSIIIMFRLLSVQYDYCPLYHTFNGIDFQKFIPLFFCHLPASTLFFLLFLFHAFFLCRPIGISVSLHFFQQTHRCGKCYCQPLYGIHPQNGRAVPSAPRPVPLWQSSRHHGACQNPFQCRVHVGRILLLVGLCKLHDILCKDNDAHCYKGRHCHL